MWKETGLNECYKNLDVIVWTEFMWFRIGRTSSIFHNYLDICFSKAVACAASWLSHFSLCVLIILDTWTKAVAFLKDSVGMLYLSLFLEWSRWVQVRNNSSQHLRHEYQNKAQVYTNSIFFFTNLMQKFFILIHLLHYSTCFKHYCAHLQEDNCISTASGIVTLFGWPFSTQVMRGLVTFRRTIVLVQDLVSSLSLGDRSVHRLWEDS